MTDTPTTELPERQLPPVEVRGKREPSPDVSVENFIKHGPEFVRNMSPQDLQAMRDKVHQMAVGAGSAEVLGAITEMMHGARTEMEKGDPDKAVVTPEQAKAQGMEGAEALNHGQMAGMAHVMEQMMCRMTRQQIDNENHIDRNLAEHGDPNQQARAQRDLAANKELEQRMNKICTPAAPPAP